MNSFLDFIMQHHKLDEVKAKFFWLWFSSKKQNEIIEELGISKSKYDEYFHYFKTDGKEIADLYVHYWRRFVANTRKGEQHSNGYEATIEDFEKLILKTRLKCCYCGVTHEQAKSNFPVAEEDKIKLRNRGRVLEIEHIINSKDSLKDDFGDDKEKFLENISLACYVCNNAKSDFFSAKTFQPVAEGIRVFWSNIFDSKNNGETLQSIENSDIWKIDKR